ncbi:family 43 glycosylhydrolase [Arthrobacter sp. KNU40]|uniref:glycoside hydrolase family 43 protein n=1 Tax=Arthrobacter sp. KNU40 TaxID=3447965 RepID=UPI003F5F5C4C
MSAAPIIPGFHPDPSICRVEDDYYLVTSSFEYKPGVPIFHSRDLTSWELIGNALERNDQLSIPSSAGGGGIYAPTIRHHGGHFWLITTNFNEVRKGHLIASATNPAGPWSSPVYTEGVLGIDPDLFWDVDGTCYLTWAGYDRTGIAILQAPINPETGAILGETQEAWQGTGLANTEAPHVYRRGDWYYLMLAEGGTERGHAVTIARSRSLAGPWESNPANPILSHRSTSSPVQNTGHADLVETPDGQWAMVYLGVRPTGPTPGFHANGRETFLAGVSWVDDWPVVDEDAFTVPEWAGDIDDEFTDTELAHHWIGPGLNPAEFTSRGPDGGIAIVPSATHRALLARRVEHQSWEARATVDAGTGRLVLRLDEAHWIAVESARDTVSARVVIGPADQVLATAAVTSAAVVLAIRSTSEATGMFPIATVADILNVGYYEAEEFTALATIDGRYISTEVAGGFTGRVIGVEPVSASKPATLRRFEYRAL